MCHCKNLAQILALSQLHPTLRRILHCFFKGLSDIKWTRPLRRWREYGEIGKHAGFKILCRKASRFKSEYSHQLPCLTMQLKKRLELFSNDAV